MNTNFKITKEPEKEMNCNRDLIWFQPQGICTGMTAVIAFLLVLVTSHGCFRIRTDSQEKKKKCSETYQIFSKGPRCNEKYNWNIVLVGLKWVSSQKKKKKKNTVPRPIIIVTPFTLWKNSPIDQLQWKKALEL